MITGESAKYFIIVIYAGFAWESSQSGTREGPQRPSTGTVVVTLAHGRTLFSGQLVLLHGCVRSVSPCTAEGRGLDGWSDWPEATQQESCL